MIRSRGDEGNQLGGHGVADQDVGGSNHVPGQYPAAAANVVQGHGDHAHGVGTEPEQVRIQDKPAARLAWVICTPLGRPVVPDEYSW